MGSSHYFKEPVFFKVSARKDSFVSLKKKSPYVVQLSSSHFWPEPQWLDSETLSSWKLSPNNINSLPRDPEEMMNMKFIFTSLLALALPGNWALSCIWVALLEKAAWMSLGWGLLCVSGLRRADWIRSQDSEVSGEEGKTVSLFCNYYTSSRNFISLLWYRQYPNQAPEYILYR